MATRGEERRAGARGKVEGSEGDGSSKEEGPRTNRTERGEKEADDLSSRVEDNRGEVSSTTSFPGLRANSNSLL
ncbi:hypothetical protein AMTR_s00006p00238340 [Amborella trichopoda]|uniref:Uncharacterized protein n=1 Tax=Amborella trichopoda TaxID=13333 RepID=W1PCP4_AMBTC|nr:hypothetical protein AMTR_s00006p00238340 [Amborella trichopoda]